MNAQAKVSETPFTPAWAEPEPDAPLLRLKHLVRGLRLQEGRAAANRGRGQAMLAQRVAHRADGRRRHRLQLRIPEDVVQTAAV